VKGEGPRRGLYGRRGFTDKVLAFLTIMAGEPLEEFGMSYRVVMTAAELLEVAKMVPRKNLDDRHNGAPKFRAFVEVAEAEPRAVFKAYVVPKERWDERVSVDGAAIPADRPDLVRRLVRRARRGPDEQAVVEVGGAKYVRLWWD
jgi:hypothetical protein